MSCIIFLSFELLACVLSSKGNDSISMLSASADDEVKSQHTVKDGKALKGAVSSAFVFVVAVFVHSSHSLDELKHDIQCGKAQRKITNDHEGRISVFFFRMTDSSYEPSLNQTDCTCSICCMLVVIYKIQTSRIYSGLLLRNKSILLCLHCTVS